MNDISRLNRRILLVIVLNLVAHSASPEQSPHLDPDEHQRPKPKAHANRNPLNKHHGKFMRMFFLLDQLE